MIRAGRLDTDRTFVLVIDLQEKLLPLVPRAKTVLRATRKLLDGAATFDLPVLATEQYSKGLGSTHAGIRVPLRATGATVIEKPTFSACGTPAVREALAAMDRPQVVLTGVETHICVLQTALDLITMDYDVFVCADAVGSRSPLDHEIALQRLRRERAAVTTVESVLFELCERCDTPRFKRMLEVIKASPPTE